MGLTEDDLRAWYREVADESGEDRQDRLDRLQTVVDHLASPGRDRARRHVGPRRWATPLAIAATVAAVTVIGVGVVTQHGDRPSPQPPVAVTTTSAAPSPTASSAPGQPTRTSVSSGRNAPPVAFGVTVSPALGSTGVAPVAPLTVTVRGGTITSLTVTGGRTATAGSMSVDRTRWTASAKPAYGTTYRVTGIAVDSTGRSHRIDGTVTTVRPAALAAVELSPQEGQVVGVAAPVTLSFPSGLDPTERAAIQARLTVTTSTPVEGAWGWVEHDDGRWAADWRPRVYWPENTRVTVRANVFGVRLAGHTYGAADVVTSFTVGRNQVVVADAHSGRLVVQQDGRQVASYAATYDVGAAGSSAGLRSGVSTVVEKIEVLTGPPSFTPSAHRMGSAVRISDSGVFIAAPVGETTTPSWFVGIRLSASDAKSFSDSVLTGDPVEVSNTPSRLSRADGDVFDWALTWPQWQQLSAD